LDKGLNLQEIFNNAVELHRMGMLPEAKARYIEVIQQVENVDLYSLIASVCLDLKQYDEAIDYALKGIEIAPEKKDLHEIIAKSYRDIGEIANAIKHYIKAYEIDPNDIQILLLISKLQYKSGLIYEAALSYKKLSIISPELERKFEPLGNILNFPV